MLEKVNAVVWGAPALMLILGIGLYLTFRGGFPQVSMLGHSVKHFAGQFSKENKDHSGYRALCTALAATVGTGNIIGVAGAIVIGGPGSIFWMWICGLLGMVIKFTEATLAVCYRSINKSGERVGGPMYMIQNGLKKKWRWLAYVYCLLGIVASFGVGNAAQVNAVVESLSPLSVQLGISEIQFSYIIGVGLAILVATVLLGGAKRIGEIAEAVVPVAAVGYILLCTLVLFLCRGRIMGAFSSIVIGAFSPKAVTGGMLGSAFVTLRIGVSRGTFTNEAGMGTASIAHASANVSHPVEQGLMGILEVFIDTIAICTMTALVILCSGIVIPYGRSSGATLTLSAFSATLGSWVNIPLTVAVCLFAIATIFGWSLYGIRCTQFLFGEASWSVYIFSQIIVVAISAMMKTKTIWLFSETLNGFMLIPNLVALLILSPEFFKLLNEYKTIRKYSVKT